MDVASAFDGAWRVALVAYRAGEVNSECTLQSLMYAELHIRLPGHLVLCEPQINVERVGYFVPDLVVLHGGLIVAIAELKFVPHGYPHYEHDLEKLNVLANCRQRFAVRLDPSSGALTRELFAVARDCTLVFGAIGKYDASAVDTSVLRHRMVEFDDRFVALVHAVGAAARH